MATGTDTQFLFDFSHEIWYQTYKYHTDESVSDTHRRVAKDLASAEDDPDKWAGLFYEALTDFKCVPGGRISSNAGTGLHGTTYINCFVGGPDGEDQDSIDGIFKALSKAALTLKSEGGYGVCSNFIRPRGAFIHGVGVESPGAVEMLRLWDTMSDVITKGSGKKKKNKKGKNKIRKGAMMVTMSCWHPDIEEFITAKQTKGQLSKFNMSVLCTDAFMEAVKKGKKWDLIYPDTTHANYKAEWDGNLEKWIEKGYPTEVYKTIEATELWDLIMGSTYNRNEPGVLFVDRMNGLNNLYYEEHINATNPCGEQLLPIGGVCLLGSINLTQFVNKNRNDWDYDKLAKYVPIFVRMLDNVNDKTKVPLPEQEWNLKNKRRIGVGYLGYGSALYLMGIRYGSRKALRLTDKLCSFVTNQCYQASASIAKEKGPFPLFDSTKYLESNFVKQALTEETVALIKKNGLRNSHLTSIQPTGNSSIYANNVSGGLEPVVSAEYVRTAIVPVPPDGMDMPTVDWTGKSITYKTDHPDTRWEWAKEGDEEILITKLGEETYKIDRNRGLTKETLVEDYAVHLLKKDGKWKADAEWAADIFNLSIKEHVDTMKTFAKYIDSAMSKTINIPHDYPYEDFKTLYMDMFDSKFIKGGTSYREGTMTSVVSATGTEAEEQSGIVKHQAPKRPKEMECNVHHLTVGGEKWVVFIGLMEDQPYEVFAGLMENIHLSKNITSGKIVKHSRNKYGFISDDMEIRDINAAFNNATQSAITRLTSMSLRHGVDIKFVVTQLLKTGNGLNTFAKCMARTLKKYINEGDELPDVRCDECGSKKVVMMEGCNKCMACGSSACS